MSKRLWSAVCTLARCAFYLSVIYLCTLLSVMEEYELLIFLMALTLVVLIFADWAIYDLITTEEAEEDD